MPHVNQKLENPVSLVAFAGYATNMKKYGTDFLNGGPRYTLGLNFHYWKNASVSILYSYNCLLLHHKPIDTQFDGEGKYYGEKELSSLGLELVGISKTKNLFKILFIAGINWAWYNEQYMEYFELTKDGNDIGGSFNSFWDNKDIIFSFGIGVQKSHFIVKPLINVGFNNRAYFSIETGWCFGRYEY